MHGSKMTNFDKLSPTQLKTFEQIAINNDAGHPQQTLDSLVRRGLIERYEERHGTALVIYRYRVPINVHFAWCEWVSK